MSASPTPPPILMGVYRFAKIMTSKSEPAILGVLPGRVWLTGADGVFFDSPAQEIKAKANATVGHVTLEVQGSKHIVAGVGSAKGAPFSPQQLQELQASRPAIAADPGSQSLLAGRALFVATVGSTDGSYQGGLESFARNELGQQRDFGAAMRELLAAVGVAL
ncbi:MAG TPA: hypothetical protein H9815_01700 [Candidatus Ruania gallistercoris]|uniref:Uncharacterized protein n=1 Tax=Candidatus Ruania gallistercoris TaxID=2838746 RepID=A0A9D2J3L0_9MICO|nr:hypothetical protein [Candidatus Ruania gallistercoris]